MLARVARAGAKQTEPRAEPQGVPPTERSACWNEEACEQKCGQNDGAAETPAGPRCAPDAERCLDEGGHQSGVTPALIRTARKPLGCVRRPHLARGKLEDELLRADHPELVTCDALDVAGVGAKGFDLALQLGDLTNELFVGLSKLADLGPKMAVAGQALIVEHERRDGHDCHHHQRKRKQSRGRSHAVSLPQGRLEAQFSAVFQGLDRMDQASTLR